MNSREHSVVEVSISNFCNFSCDYCISSATHKKVPTNPDGSARIFKDLRFNEKGMVDHRRIRKFGLIVRGKQGDTYNFGIEMPDGTIDRSGDHVIEHDFIDYGKLLNFLRTKLPGWVVQLGGGEPLHNPGIVDFLKNLTQTHKVILLTNLSLIKARKEILDIPDDMMFYRVGFHPEQYQVERYLENIDIIRKAGKKYIINYVLHPRHYENGMGKAYVDFLKDNSIEYEVTRFYGKWDGEDHPLPELSPMEKELLAPHSISNAYTTDPNTPGTKYLSIYPDGNIYQCSKKTVCLGSIYGSFKPYHRMPMKSCFSGGNKCQSVISQEYVLGKWID